MLPLLVSWYLWTQRLELCEHVLLVVKVFRLFSLFTDCHIFALHCCKLFCQSLFLLSYLPLEWTVSFWILQHLIKCHRKRFFVFILSISLETTYLIICNSSHYSRVIKKIFLKFVEKLYSFLGRLFDMRAILMERPEIVLNCLCVCLISFIKFQRVIVHHFKIFTL